jgi:hypothetical protein
MRAPRLLSSTVAALPLALLATAGCAQEAPLARIDEVVERTMREQRIPGVALAVLRDGKMVIAKCYGLANVEHQVPVTPETVFQSGSIRQAAHRGGGDDPGRGRPAGARGPDRAVLGGRAGELEADHRSPPPHPHLGNGRVLRPELRPAP